MVRRIRLVYSICFLECGGRPGMVEKLGMALEGLVDWR